jgi:hypothetical protein
MTHLRVVAWGPAVVLAVPRELCAESKCQGELPIYVGYEEEPWRG